MRAIGLAAALLTGCAGVYQPEFHPNGDYAFVQNRGVSEACTAPFLELLEQDVWMYDTRFPAFASDTGTTGHLVLLDTDIELVIEAAGSGRTSKAIAKDTDQSAVVEAMRWGLAEVSFETEAMCKGCMDQIVVAVNTQEEGCQPLVVYEK